VLIGIVIPYTAFGKLLGFTALPAAFLLFLAVASITYLFLVEMVKRRLMRRLLV
jgi:Mg2+-importing ATPase